MIHQLTVFRDTFYYAISKIVPGLSGLVSVVFFIRIVGPEEYGKYSLFLAQCNLIVAIAFGWLNQANLRYFSKDKDSSELL